MFLNILTYLTTLTYFVHQQQVFTHYVNHQRCHESLDIYTLLDFTYNNYVSADFLLDIFTQLFVLSGLYILKMQKLLISISLPLVFILHFHCSGKKKLSIYITPPR